MKKIIIALVSLMFAALAAETIVLNDGTAQTGDIVAKQNHYVYLKVENQIYKFHKEVIKQILNEGNQPITIIFWRKRDFATENLIGAVELVPNTPPGEMVRSNTKNDVKYKTKVKYGHLSLFVASSVLAWDNFASIADINKSIRIAEKLQDENISQKTVISNLKKQRTRKIVCGVALTISSAVIFNYSFDKVEVQASLSSVNVSCRF